MTNFAGAWAQTTGTVAGTAASFRLYTSGAVSQAGTVSSVTITVGGA